MARKAFFWQKLNYSAHLISIPFGQYEMFVTFCGSSWGIPTGRLPIIFNLLTLLFQLQLLQLQLYVPLLLHLLDLLLLQLVELRLQRQSPSSSAWQPPTFSSCVYFVPLVEHKTMPSPFWSASFLRALSFNRGLLLPAVKICLFTLSLGVASKRPGRTDRRFQDVLSVLYLL